jgi:hypothetical protein
MKDDIIDNQIRELHYLIGCLENAKKFNVVACKTRIQGVIFDLDLVKIELNKTLESN